MVILMVTAPIREDQGRSGSITSVKTAPTWTFHYTRLPISLRTGRHGGTLFNIWAANARCHRHRRNGRKSSKSHFRYQRQSPSRRAVQLSRENHRHLDLVAPEAVDVPERHLDRADSSRRSRVRGPPPAVQMAGRTARRVGLPAGRWTVER